MEIYCVSDYIQTKTVDYQNNYIELLYGQNCGTYSLTLEPTDPTCDLTAALTFDSSTGSGGPNALSYQQAIILESSDQSQVGQCSVDMVISQI